MAKRFSQNGWEAFATPQKGKFVRFQACGEGWWAANDDVAVVFKEFIERFNKEVEPIEQRVLDDWSYANRLVRGSTSVVSNHGSATAIDLNALKHPRGVQGTFNKGKQSALRKLKNSITDNAGRPVLRLGMDYNSTVDDMHVEVDVDAARMKQAADKIRKAHKEAEDDFMADPKDVWDSKGVDMIPHNKVDKPKEPTDPANPTWKPVSVLEETNRLVRSLVGKVDDLQDEVKTLRAEVKASKT